MKAYFEYEGGTFWAICTEGNACFTAQDKKYRALNPDVMLKAGSEEEKNYLPQVKTQKTTYADSATAEAEGLKLHIKRKILRRIIL
jgi:hypothetical protein